MSITPFKCIFCLFRSYDPVQTGYLAAIQPINIVPDEFKEELPTACIMMPDTNISVVNDPRNVSVKGSDVKAKM